MPAGTRDVEPHQLGAAVARLAATFDAAHGGFGGAPKFPPPMILEFLLRSWHRTRDDATLRLRATLRAYLDEGCSFAAAARRLGIHEKTVRYRVRQCEEALARPVGEQSQKLAAALLLAETLESGA